MDLKLGGIVSGLDTNDLITKMMQIERMPLQSIKSRQNTYTLKKNLWSEINTSLLALKTANDTLFDANTYKKRTAATSDETVITATAGDAAAETTYNVTVTSLAKNHQIRGDHKDSTWRANVDGAFTLSDGTYTSTINVSATDSLQSIADKINEAKDNTESTKALGITASVVDNTLVLTHDQTGSANTISFTASNAILDNIGLVNAGTTTIKNEYQAQADAVFSINGINVTRSRNDNLTDVISGITLNLKKESTATLTVKKDVDAALSTVKGFVEKYNAALDLINTKMSEEKVKEPLIEADRKKGLLRGDSVLAGIKSRLRLNISNPVDGLPASYDRLSAIGITTISDDFGKSGKLQIDESKLKEALSANPEAVIQLFTNNTDVNANGTITLSEKGIAARIDEELSNLTNSSTRSIGGVIVKSGTIPSTIDSIDKVIKGYSEQIESFEERLALREKALWAKFTALETSLSTMNNQATWLAGQLMGLS